MAGLLATLAAAAVAANGEGPRAATPPPQSSPQAADQTILPFANRQDRMTVPVQIDGRGPYAFVVDTGAERSVVSQELASSLALAEGPVVRVFGFAGVSDVGTVRVRSLSVSRLGATAVEAPALTTANLGAPGMLGIDALQGHRVSIDFTRKRMVLIPAHKRARGDVVVRANDRLGQLIVADARFNSHPISVVIDTGSPISVGNRAMLALTKRSPHRLGPISVTAVTGQSFDADYVMVSNVHIGGLRLDNVALAFADVPPFDRFGLLDTPALIVGMDTLRLFRQVDIDFANREIQFTMPVPAFINFAGWCGRISCKSLRVN